MGMDKITTLKDLCSFAGFRALARTTAHPDHPGAVVVTLKRRQKKRFVRAGKFTAGGTTHEKRLFVIWTLLGQRYIWRFRSGVFNAGGAGP